MMLHVSRFCLVVVVLVALLSLPAYGVKKKKHSPSPGPHSSSSNTDTKCPYQEFGTTNTPEGLVELARYLFEQASRPDEARTCYTQATKLDPNFGLAYLELGNTYFAPTTETPDYGKAIKLFEKAIQVSPDLVMAHVLMAEAYAKQGKHHQAIPAYAEAIRLRPNFYQVYNNYGNSLKAIGDLEGARRVYEQAVTINPNFLEGLVSLGSLHTSMDNYEQALPYLERAHALQPNHYYVLFHLSRYYLNMQPPDYDRAIKLIDECIQLNPPILVEALSLKGDIVFELARPLEALQYYEKALEVNPNSANIHNKIGTTLAKISSADPDITARKIYHYRRAIELDPTFDVAYTNLGKTLRDIGRIPEALELIQTAISLSPNSSEAWNHLADLYQGLERYAEAITAYRRALELNPSNVYAFCNMVYVEQFVCEWRDREQHLTRLAEIISTQAREAEQGGAAAFSHECVHPFMAQSYGLSGETLRLLAKRHAASAMYTLTQLPIATKLAPIPPVATEELRGERTANRREGTYPIRVGYVSADFGDHPVGKMVSSLFVMHDRNRFEVFAYSARLHNPSSTVWQTIYNATGSDHYISIVDMSNIDTARRIRSDLIDILVNLNGYTDGERNELFAMRPAPLAVFFMGFPGTSGAPFIDYIVTDPITSPPELAEKLFTEKPMFMPHTHFITDHRQSYSAVLRNSTKKSRGDILREQGVLDPSVAVDNSTFIFCNFNKLYKVSPNVFDIWMRLLQRVPHAVLWLQAHPKDAIPQLQREARERSGPDVAKRLVFTPKFPDEEHLSIKSHCDLFLDTFTYNAMTTAADAMWAGVPVLTMPGEAMPTRVAASIVSAAGLADVLLAHNTSDYEEKAVFFATHPEEHIKLRERVRTARLSSPLFDTRQWVLDFERGLEEMFDIWLRGEPPRAIYVNPSQAPHTPLSVVAESKKELYS